MHTLFFKKYVNIIIIFIGSFLKFFQIFLRALCNFFGSTNCSKVSLLNEPGDFKNIWEIIDDFEDYAISEP